MIAFLRTWRYGIDTTNAYHGSAIVYDAGHSLLVTKRPVLPYKPDGSPVTGHGYVGLVTITTVVSGDEVTVVPCDACDLHQDTLSVDQDARKLFQIYGLTY